MKIFFAMVDVAAMIAYEVFIHENLAWGISRGGTGTPIKSRRLKAYHRLALQLTWPQITARYLATPNLPNNIIGAMKVKGGSIGEELPVKPRHPLLPQPAPLPRIARQAVGRCYLCPEETVRRRQLAYKCCSICNRPVCTNHRRLETFCEECQLDVARPVVQDDQIVFPDDD